MTARPSSDYKPSAPQGTGAPVEEAFHVLMPLCRCALRAPLPNGLCLLLAGALVLGAAALHVAYLANDCPLDLAPDEAHYWDWSRHLDWSYYSKGPLVAYLIRAGCEVAGAWSEQHTGSLTFAIRLPAVLCGSLLLVALYVLTVQVYGRHGLALAVVAAALTVPVIAVGAVVMTIDAPYTCCWGWALVFAHRAVFRGSGWAWPAAGLAVGLGILAKYTMVMFLPSVGLFLLTAAEHRPLLRRPGFWAMCAIAGLCCFPILMWNLHYDWVTIRHVLRIAGVVAGDGEPRSGTSIHWLGPLTYLGGQCALLLIFWFAAWLLAMIRHRPWREPDAGVRYLWWTSAPMFLLFLGFSFKTGGGELNWPVTAYLSGSVLGAAWLARQLTSPVGWYRRVTICNLSLACGVGLLGTVCMHASHHLYPVLTKVVGPPTEERPCPLRGIDPTCRLRGWRTLAAAVDRLRAELATADGEGPVLIAGSWSLPGELGVYCAGHPQAHSVGLAIGDRHSQYDLWAGPLNQPEPFLGRTFLLVGGATPEVRAAFREVGPPILVRHSERGHPISVWTVTVCKGFKGFAPLKRREPY